MSALKRRVRCLCTFGGGWKVVVFLTRPPATCPLTPRPITSSFRRSGRSPGIAWTRGGGARRLPRQSASAVHLSLQQRRNMSPLVKASACLPHHRGARLAGAQEDRHQRVGKVDGKRRWLQTKAGHMTETCSASSMKVEERNPMSPSATADQRPEQNNRWGGGTDPGSFPT